jgi:hypothetical protein
VELSPRIERSGVHRHALYSFPMRRLLLNFQLNKGWTFHFIDEDCKSSVGSGHYTVHELTTLRRSLIKLRCEDIDDFDHSIRAWARGSVYVRLSDEQCRFFGISPK